MKTKKRLRLLLIIALCLFPVFSFASGQDDEIITTAVRIVFPSLQENLTFENEYFKDIAFKKFLSSRLAASPKFEAAFKDYKKIQIAHEDKDAFIVTSSVSPQKVRVILDKKYFKQYTQYLGDYPLTIFKDVNTAKSESIYFKNILGNNHKEAAFKILVPIMDQLFIPQKWQLYEENERPGNEEEFQEYEMNYEVTGPLDDFHQRFPYKITKTEKGSLIKIKRNDGNVFHRDDLVEFEREFPLNKISWQNKNRSGEIPLKPFLDGEYLLEKPNKPGYQEDASIKFLDGNGPNVTLPKILLDKQVLSALDFHYLEFTDYDGEKIRLYRDDVYHNRFSYYNEYGKYYKGGHFAERITGYSKFEFAKRYEDWGQRLEEFKTDSDSGYHKSYSLINMKPDNYPIGVTKRPNSNYQNYTLENFRSISSFEEFERIKNFSVTIDFYSNNGEKIHSITQKNNAVRFTDYQKEDFVLVDVKSLRSRIQYIGNKNFSNTIGAYDVLYFRIPLKDKMKYFYEVSTVPIQHESSFLTLPFNEYQIIYRGYRSLPDVEDRLKREDGKTNATGNNNGAFDFATPYFKASFNPGEKADILQSMTSQGHSELKRFYFAIRNYNTKKAVKKLKISMLQNPSSYVILNIQNQNQWIELFADITSVSSSTLDPKYYKNGLAAGDWKFEILDEHNQKIRSSDIDDANIRIRPDGGIENLSPLVFPDSAFWMPGHFDGVSLGGEIWERNYHDVSTISTRKRLQINPYGNLAFINDFDFSEPGGFYDSYEKEEGYPGNSRIKSFQISIFGGTYGDGIFGTQPFHLRITDTSGKEYFSSFINPSDVGRLNETSRFFNIPITPPGEVGGPGFLSRDMVVYKDKTFHFDFTFLERPPVRKTIRRMPHNNTPPSYLRVLSSVEIPFFEPDKGGFAREIFEQNRGSGKDVLGAVVFKDIKIQGIEDSWKPFTIEKNAELFNYSDIFPEAYDVKDKVNLRMLASYPGNYTAIHLKKHLVNAKGGKFSVDFSALNKRRIRNGLRKVGILEPDGTVVENKEFVYSPTIGKTQILDPIIFTALEPSSGQYRTSNTITQSLFSEVNEEADASIDRPYVLYNASLSPTIARLDQLNFIKNKGREDSIAIDYVGRFRHNRYPKETKSGSSPTRASEREQPQEGGMVFGPVWILPTKASSPRDGLKYRFMSNPRNAISYSHFYSVVTKNPIVINNGNPITVVRGVPHRMSIRLDLNQKKLEEFYSSKAAIPVREKNNRYYYELDLYPYRSNTVETKLGKYHLRIEGNRDPRMIRSHIQDLEINVYKAKFELPDNVVEFNIGEKKFFPLQVALINSKGNPVSETMSTKDWETLKRRLSVQSSDAPVGIENGMLYVGPFDNTSDVRSINIDFKATIVPSSPYSGGLPPFFETESMKIRVKEPYRISLNVTPLEKEGVQTQSYYDKAQYSFYSESPDENPSSVPFAQCEVINGRCSIEIPRLDDQPKTIYVKQEKRAPLYTFYNFITKKSYNEKSNAASAIVLQPNKTAYDYDIAPERISLKDNSFLFATLRNKRNANLDVPYKITRLRDVRSQSFEGDKSISVLDDLNPLPLGNKERSYHLNGRSSLPTKIPTSSYFEGSTNSFTEGIYRIESILPESKGISNTAVHVELLFTPDGNPLVFKVAGQNILENYETTQNVEFEKSSNVSLNTEEKTLINQILFVHEPLAAKDMDNGALITNTGTYGTIAFILVGGVLIIISNRLKKKERK